MPTTAPTPHALPAADLALSPADAALLARLAPPTPTAYHRLNPLTRATLAAVTTAGALLLGGYAAPLLLLATLVVPGALVARVLGSAIRISLLVSLPIAVSVALVSVFLRGGATVLFAVGPFQATLEGMDIAAQLLLRLFVMAMALALFGLTTPPRALVADLERRGVSPRLTFAVTATLETVPALLERARAIQSAQRARGLDTEGSIGARLRGVLPLAAPLLLSSLGEVEERTLALEARGFGRPGARHLFWTPTDTGWERVLRWSLAVGLAAILVARAAGVLPALP